MRDLPFNDPRRCQECGLPLTPFGNDPLRADCGGIHHVYQEPKESVFLTLLGFACVFACLYVAAVLS